MGDFFDNPWYSSPTEPAWVEQFFDSSGYRERKAAYDSYMAAVPYNANHPETAWIDRVGGFTAALADFGFGEIPDDVRAYRRRAMWDI